MDQSAIVKRRRSVFSQDADPYGVPGQTPGMLDVTRRPDTPLSARETAVQPAATASIRQPVGTGQTIFNELYPPVRREPINMGGVVPVTRADPVQPAQPDPYGVPGQTPAKDPASIRPPAQTLDPTKPLQPALDPAKPTNALAMGPGDGPQPQAPQFFKRDFTGEMSRQDWDIDPKTGQRIPGQTHDVTRPAGFASKQVDQSAAPQSAIDATNTVVNTPGSRNVKTMFDLSTGKVASVSDPENRLGKMQVTQDLTPYTPNAATNEIAKANAAKNAAIDAPGEAAGQEAKRRMIESRGMTSQNQRKLADAGANAAAASIFDRNVGRQMADAEAQRQQGIIGAKGKAEEGVEGVKGASAIKVAEQKAKEAGDMRQAEELRSERIRREKFQMDQDRIRTRVDGTADANEKKVAQKELETALRTSQKDLSDGKGSLVAFGAAVKASKGRIEGWDAYHAEYVNKIQVIANQYAGKDAALARRIAEALYDANGNELDPRVVSLLPSN